MAQITAHIFATINWYGNIVYKVRDFIPDDESMAKYYADETFIMTKTFEIEDVSKETILLGHVRNLEQYRDIVRQEMMDEIARTNKQINSLLAIEAPK